MKPRGYCCCAIPLINAGIYTTLIEQFVLGILVGTLSIATPRIVGAATPGMAPWIMAIVCYVVAALQILGFIGVSKERAILYRRYVTLHLLAMVAAFGIAAVWIIISATRHGPAVSRCLQDFFATSDSKEEGTALCDIFAWVDIGLMGALWLFLAIVQAYLYVVISSYGSSQQQAHDDFAAIPLKSRDNSRPSAEPLDNYQHVRAASDLSETELYQGNPLDPKPSHRINESESLPSFEPYHQGYTAEAKPPQHSDTYHSSSFEPHRGYSQNEKPFQAYVSPLRQ